ncbi:MAG: sugar ABC transporter permease [Spirochaetales bacterium]|nr:sugar ABC transporter permease [Spirochaetales bacterium]
MQKPSTAGRKPFKAERYIGLVFIAPWIIGFLVFQLYPFVSSFIYSFTSFNIIGKPKFVGLSNYVKLFTIDPDFKKSIYVTLKYAFISVPGKLIFALFIAMLMNMKIRGVNFMRTIFYLPSILGGSVAISALWKLLFMKEGMINNILGAIHIPAVDWLGSPHVAIFTISLLQVWQFGSSMVLFLAALKNIPAEYYESASLDGASKIRQFFSITFPMITPIVFFNLIMQMINALQSFTSAFVITNGGPLKSTYLIGIKLYIEGFNNFKMGYAAAISWVLFFMILCFTLIVFKSSSAWVYYSDGEAN